MKRLKSNRLSHLADGEEFPTPAQKRSYEEFEKQQAEDIAKTVGRKYQPTWPSELPLMFNLHVAPPTDPDKMRDPFLFLTCECGAVEGIPADQSRSSFGSFVATESQESPDGMTYSCLQCKNESNIIKVEIDEGTDP